MMSNQDRLLSDEEMLEALGFTYIDKEGGYYIHHYVRKEKNPSSLNSVLIPHVAEKIIGLINTQKRLYAESVIGEDLELPKMAYGHDENGNYISGGEIQARVDAVNRKLAEQRARL